MAKKKKKPEPVCETKRGRHWIRVYGSRRKYTASVCWNGERLSTTSVLGTYETKEAAVEAGETVIATVEVPRINKPADISQHRRECPRQTWALPAVV